MSTKTSNLGLTIWNDTDPVDFEEINSNFQTIDRLVSCIESGIVTTSYNGETTTDVNWYYKKYSDGVTEACAILLCNTLTCNTGTAAPYASAVSTINFPFTFSTIYNIQMNLVSETTGWIANTSVSLDRATFKVCNIVQETEATYKQVCVSVKGKIN